MHRKVWIAVGAVVCLALAAGLILPALQPAREGRPRPKCMTNLRQIALACELYSGDHNETFPPSLGALFPDLISDGGLFLCPVGGGAVEITEGDLPEGATDASAVWGERFSDYAYVAGLRSSNDPAFVLAYDRDGNHEGGRCVAFIGSMVRWMKEPEFRAALAETEAWLREHPRPARAE